MKRTIPYAEALEKHPKEVAFTPMWDADMTAPVCYSESPLRQPSAIVIPELHTATSLKCEPRELRAIWKLALVCMSRLGCVAHLTGERT